MFKKWVSAPRNKLHPKYSQELSQIYEIHASVMMQNFSGFYEIWSIRRETYKNPQKTSEIHKNSHFLHGFEHINNVIFLLVHVNSLQK